MAVPKQPQRILVTDDVEEIVTVWKVNLEAEGYEVQGTTDSREALEWARTWPPDLITTDILKPVWDGLELIQRLKADPATQAIPVLVISAWGGESLNRPKVLAAGAAAVLAKPVDPEELVETVRNLLKR